MVSHESEPEEDLTLKFVLDGVLYSLSVMQEGETKDQLMARAKFWLPDVHILDENNVERIPKEPNGL